MTDCLTVLCFKITELTQSKTQLEERANNVIAAMKKTIDGAKKLAAEAKQCVEDLPASGEEADRLRSLITKLEESLQS